MITEQTANQLRAELNAGVGQLATSLYALVAALDGAPDLATLQQAHETAEARKALAAFTHWLERAKQA